MSESKCGDAGLRLAPLLRSPPRSAPLPGSHAASPLVTLADSPWCDLNEPYAGVR